MTDVKNFVFRLKNLTLLINRYWYIVCDDQNLEKGQDRYQGIYKGIYAQEQSYLGDIGGEYRSMTSGER